MESLGAGYLRPACELGHSMLAKTRAWHPDDALADLGPLAKLESVAASNRKRDVKPLLDTCIWSGATDAL
jgi:hypothetical protein